MTGIIICSIPVIYQRQFQMEGEKRHRLPLFPGQGEADALATQASRGGGTAGTCSGRTQSDKSRPAYVLEAAAGQDGVRVTRA